MKTWEDIAVIAMAGKFPQSQSLEEYRKNLLSKRDSIREVPLSRLRLLELDEEQEYLQCGYLEGIDEFDYEYFGVSKGEAELMDPQKRIMLMLSYEVLLTGGYTPESLRGSKTAVILSAGQSGYIDYLQEKSGSVAQMANNPGMIAGNLAYYFDFHSKAYMVDTTCSSSLFAIYQACQELACGEADLAIAGGISVIVSPKSTKEMDFASTGVVSREMRSRTFDESANGTGIGEGAGVVLLKRLEDALDDGDYIHAVIRGGAVNHDGARCNSAAAPSPIAQEEMINQAWSFVEGVPEAIEAHGTGTKLGDPIEVEALAKAFSHVKEPIYLTAVKTNLGHLSLAAGVASFIKAVLSLSHNEIYPLVHFKRGNQLIPWEETSLLPNDQVRAYRNASPFMGISALGLSGTNVHLVLQAWNQTLKEEHGQEKTQNKKQHIFTLSSRNQLLLEEYRDHMLSFIEAKPGLDDKLLCQNLNLFREKEAYRLAFSYNDGRERIEKLKTTSLLKAASKDIFLVCNGVVEGPAALWKHYASIEESSIKSYLVFYRKLIQRMKDLGIDFRSILSCRGGYKVADLLMGASSLESCIEVFPAAQKLQPDVKRLASYLDSLVGREVLFLCFETEGEIYELLKEKFEEDRILRPNDEEELLCSLYIHGKNPRWENYYKQPIEKYPLPTPPLQRLSCWPKNLKPQLSQVQKPKEKQPVLSIEESLRELWQETLGVAEIYPEDDFFELGGNSILGIKLIQSVSEVFGEQLEMEEVYANSTIKAMAEILEKKKGKGADLQEKVEIDPYEIQALTPSEDYALSDAQERMWLMNSLSLDKIQYNMPSTMVIKGKLDLENFKTAFQSMVDHHEVFRTTFHLVEGSPRQKIHQRIKLRIPVLEMSEKEAIDYKKSFIRPFNLEEAPLLRISVIKIAPNHYWILMDMHHIISDGTSMGIISKDFWTVYGGERLEKKTIDYKDFAAWQKNFSKTSLKQKQDEYWLKELDGYQQVHAGLPKDFAPPSKRDDDGELLQFRLEKDLLKELRTLSRQKKVTLNTLFLSFYFISLFKSTFTDEIIVGVPITGRKTRQTNSILGMFVNMLPIRMKASTSENYSDFLRRLNDKLQAAYKNQDTQFNEMVDLLKIQRRANQNPLFESVFVLQELEMPSSVEQDAEFEYINEDKTAKFDLVFSGYHQGDDIVFGLRYWKKIFKKETIEGMIRLFLSIMKDVLEKDQPLSSLGKKELSSLDMMSEEEGNRIEFYF